MNTQGGESGPPKLEERRRAFTYVYLIRSVSSPGETYTGVTSDLRQRLKSHNWGQSPHTAKHRPWELEAYFAFRDEARARDFERYLKSGSGRAFLNKRIL